MKNYLTVAVKRERSRPMRTTTLVTRRERMRRRSLRFFRITGVAESIATARMIQQEYPPPYNDPRFMLSGQGGANE